MHSTRGALLKFCGRIISIKLYSCSKPVVPCELFLGNYEICLHYCRTVFDSEYIKPMKKQIMKCHSRAVVFPSLILLSIVQ